ncbi:MAG TPA: tyrosinase family protein [Bacilli bacterium]|nr:tyrosinase family protein [Bacilli bacterium]
MADIQTLRLQVRDLLKQRVPQPQQDQLLTDSAPKHPFVEKFTNFDVDAMTTAMEYVKSYMKIADANPGTDGLERVLNEVQQDLRNQNPTLIKYALMVFLTHDKNGQKLTRAIPTMEERLPQFVTPSKPSPGLLMTEEVGGVDESVLHWWREDPLVNEHHEHWHVVYPTSGLPNLATDSFQIKDRQGELFLYMHEQMVARYDAERLAVGLPRVKPFDDLTAPIAEGYDSTPARDQEDKLYPPRNAGSKLPTEVEAMHLKLSDLQGWTENLMGAIKEGHFSYNDDKGNPVTLPITPSLLGTSVEANIGSVSRSVYGNLHNMGHMFIASIRDLPTGADPSQYGEFGVMSDTATALRDPIFWRWHKHIDDISYAWQETQPAHDFSDAPSVAMHDIILLNNEGLPALHQDSQGQPIAAQDDLLYNYQAVAEQAFGGDKWAQDFSSGTFSFTYTNPATGKAYDLSITTTDELKTEMQKRSIHLYGHEEVEIDYVNHEPFLYALRLENRVNMPKKVTARLFLVPETEAKDRRAWIEMDKFQVELNPLEQKVVARRDRHSSVIRKPAVDPSVAPDFDPSHEPSQDPENADSYYYCDCGWPYSMLLPRGTGEGMKFRLLVMLTDWEIDRVEDNSSCGSMSYCGAKDKYPDTRPMGYPFDRNFTQPIAETFKGMPNVETRGLSIRWTNAKA